MTVQDYPNLLQISSPSDLKGLSIEQLTFIADETRQYIIQTLNRCGGHFAGNLGTVELAVVLHAIFDAPQDNIVWDVGHQAYPHKVLTGRRDQLTTIRQSGGLAPFLKRGESEYDAFGVGHSSTSISAALGMALASKLKDTPQKNIAVIGDGGMTAGMAFEALNHAGDCDADLLVILNDNDMSISPNVGALSNYFTRMMSGKLYSGMRDGSRKLLKNLPQLKTLARKTEIHMKGMFSPGTLFEELGFTYFGPIDGHDLATLHKTLENLKTLDEPRLLHIVTKKGKGYAKAEDDPVKYHAVKPGFIEADEGDCASQKAGKDNPNKGTGVFKSFSHVFGAWLCASAARDDTVVGITPAMCEGSGMTAFRDQFPDRYHDVAIAEQHAVTVAAGMACEGVKPVVAIYSTFLQRAYDQLIHDVAIQNLDVTFAVDRAGLVGADGPTHAGSFDLGFARMIPNMVIATPSNEQECWQLLNTALKHRGPALVRYPRGAGRGHEVHMSDDTVEVGKAKTIRQGHDIAILNFGTLLPEAEQVANHLNATLIDMRFVKPIDEAIIVQCAANHDVIITLEDNAVMGGAGSAVSEVMHAHQQVVPILMLGLPDTFIEHGDQKSMLRDCGLSAEGIMRSIQAFCDKTSQANYL